MSVNALLITKQTNVRLNEVKLRTVKCCFSFQITTEWKARNIQCTLYYR